MNPGDPRPFHPRAYYRGYRRSIVGPLILIGLGCIFLISNINPDLPIWQFAADYWPFLLIGWGAIRAAEVVFTHSQGRPLPRFGISGGEWMLAIFLIIFGSILFAGHRFGERFPNANIARRGLQIFGEGFDFPVTASIQAGTAPKLSIQDFSGDVRIVTGDGETIQVRGHSTVRAFADKDARRFHDMSPLELVREGDNVVLRIRRGSDVPGLVRLSADLDITVPKGTSLEARGQTGDYDVTGITGDVDINNDNAGVRLNNIGGQIRIETRRSDIVHINGAAGNVELRGGGEDLELENIMGEVKVAGFYRGDLSFRALAKPLRVENRGTELRIDKLEGSIRMDRGDFEADNIHSPLMLRTGSTDVKLNRFTGPVEIEVARGDVQLFPAAGALSAWKIRTGAGDIEAALPAAFELVAHTGRGEISTDYSGIRTDNRNGNAEARGTVGKGPLLDLSTGRGNIRVNKGEGPRELERVEQ